MIQFALLLSILVALPAVPAGAQTPPPAHIYHHTAVQHRASAMTFTNPATGRGQSSMNGQGCIGPRANAAQTATNPINGQSQAATIVAVPLNGGSVASATNRAQQSQACAQSRAH